MNGLETGMQRFSTLNECSARSSDLRQSGLTFLLYLGSFFLSVCIYARADDAVAAHYRTIDRRDKFRKAEDCPRIKLLASGRRLLGYSERKYLQKGKMTQN